MHDYDVAKRRGDDCCMSLHQPVADTPITHIDRSMLLILAFTRIHDSAPMHSSPTSHRRWDSCMYVCTHITNPIRTGHAESLCIDARPRAVVLGQGREYEQWVAPTNRQIRVVHGGCLLYVLYMNIDIYICVYIYVHIYI